MRIVALDYEHDTTCPVQACMNLDTCQIGECMSESHVHYLTPLPQILSRKHHWSSGY